MSERLLSRRHQIPDRDRTADDWSPSTSDVLHDSGRADSHVGNRAREATDPTGEHNDIVPVSASGAGHSMASICIVPQAESAASPAGGPVSPETAARIEAVRGTGSALDAGTREVMDGTFDTSFAGVHIHADGEANALNRAVGGAAFTTGSDIFFRQGGFEPRSSAGRQLLAHELGHVVQKRGMQ
jgi:Domain of unknown function (DUF4157)